jgi:hypothetical protein
MEAAAPNFDASPITLLWEYYIVAGGIKRAV